MTAGSPVTGDGIRDPELDGLRGVAIALVLAGHLLTFRLGVSWAAPLGALGVQLFFALSGFLITRLLVRELDARGRINFKHFYIRRAFRIFPAFYVFLAVVALLIVTGSVTDTNWRSFLAAGLYISNIRGSSVTLGHTWSLALEEQFYALWPVCLGLLPRPGRRRLTLFLVLLFMLWRAVAISLQLWSYESSVFYERTDFRLDSLLVGGLLALDEPRSRAATHSQALWLAMSAVAFFVSPVLGRVVPLRPIALSVSVIASAGVLKGVLNCSGSAITGVLRHSWLRGLGRISYSVYLWQQPLLVSTLVGVPMTEGALFGLFACLIVGLASFALVEQPMLRLRDSYRSGLREAEGPLSR